MTQLELADKLGVTDRAVSKWEVGKSLPDISMLEPLCLELHLQMDELISGKSTEYEKKKQKPEEKNRRNKARIVGGLIFLGINLLVFSLLSYFQPIWWFFVTRVQKLICGGIILAVEAVILVPVVKNNVREEL